MLKPANNNKPRDASAEHDPSADNLTNRAAEHPIVLELTVRNDPGVISHVCSLFARRTYNLDGILCMPVGDGQESRIWLRINDSQRIDQIEKQILKLHDVLDVSRHAVQRDLFVQLEHFLMNEC